MKFVLASLGLISSVLACADDSECQASEFCNIQPNQEPACLAKYADDAACEADNECTSEFCGANSECIVAPTPKWVELMYA